MERVACLNLSAQNDGRSLTPSVSDLGNFLNEEFTTVINVQILAAFLAQSQDILMEYYYKLTCQISLQYITVRANSQTTIAWDPGVAHCPIRCPFTLDGLFTNRPRFELPYPSRRPVNCRNQKYGFSEPPNI